MPDIAPVYLAATGHRPKKLPRLSAHSEKLLLSFAIQELERIAPYYVLSGMAMGWDLAVAKAAIDLGILLHAVIPFPTQFNKWPATSIDQWHICKHHAAIVTVIADDWTPEVYFDRNKYLVDHCNWLLGLWDGKPQGGTAHCMAYARARQRERDFTVENVFDKYRSFAECQ